ncbi:MAG: outer membrane protein [Myxococcaceae bacterium]|nr:outer membrane protein [Myxococcaceae bacterium]
MKQTRLFFARAPKGALRPLALIALSLTLASASLTSSVSAQSRGFALDRFEPSERGSEWFALDSLDLRGHVRPALGLVADYGYKPLVIYDRAGHEVSPLIAHQLFLHLGGSLVLWERLRVAINLPLSPLVRGDGGLVGTQQISAREGGSLGDLRLSADVRLFGKYRGPITGAFGASVWLPTGSRGSFAGDGKVRAAPHFALAGELAKLNYAARVGFNYRARDGSFSGSDIGSELTFGGALGLRVAGGNLLLGPEVYGSTVVQGGLFRKRGTPVEGIFGAHYLIAGQVRVGGGVGAGFTQGFGSPEIRALASLEWAPTEPEAPSDRDHDSILDPDDACPDEPGIRSNDPQKNGCPLRDRDGDDILDDDDACPDEAGVPSADPEKNGCPVKDRDGDGIHDDDDACPDAAGPKNDDPKKNGCPPARIERGQIRILEQVQFRTGSAEILPVSDEILGAVLRIFEAHPEISKVSVEGHTDNVGGAKYNKGLSEQRVLSVLSWLTSHGVEPIRLTSAGFGLDRPLASNETEEGRAQNRRVEFHIREVDGKPVDADGRPLTGQE